MSVIIGKKVIGFTNPVFVVGEIGINHNGDIKIAKKLIDAAVDSGCDAVKFQKRTVSAVYTKEELEKPREVPAHIISQAINRGVLPKESVARLTASNLQNTTNGDLKLALEFTHREYAEIDAYCKEKNILWFASPWDEESISFLERLNPPCYKIASASLTDLALLRLIRKKKRPVILSTGMRTEKEITRAVDTLGSKNLIILHAVSTYPSSDEEINLSVLKTLQKKFSTVPIGYSGHEQGIALSFAAAALGAVMIERHITLDRTMWGSDQAASLEPKDFKLLIRDLRRLANARGDGKKRLLENEIPIKNKLRRK